MTEKLEKKKRKQEKSISLILKLPVFHTSEENRSNTKKKNQASMTNFTSFFILALNEKHCLPEQSSDADWFCTQLLWRTSQQRGSTGQRTERPTAPSSQQLWDKQPSTAADGGCSAAPALSQAAPHTGTSPFTVLLHCSGSKGYIILCVLWQGARG